MCLLAVEAKYKTVYKTLSKTHIAKLGQNSLKLDNTFAQLLYTSLLGLVLRLLILKKPEEIQELDLRSITSSLN